MSNNQLIRTATVVAAVTAGGRFLGFFRDMTIANLFGATSDTDAYLIAWTIPETAAPLLLEGAMLFVLIPLFAQSKQNDIGLPRAMGETVTVLSGTLAVFSLGAFVLAPYIAEVLGPGLEDHRLAAEAIRLASATLVLFGLAGFLTAALRTENIFGITAAVYIAYNVGILACIFLLRSSMGILSAALGLSVGAFLMVAIQIPSFARTHGRIRLHLPLSDEIRTGLISFVPIAVFILLRHAQVYVERFLGSNLDAGSISRLNFAERIAQVPMSVVIAFAIVSFPKVARSAAAQKVDQVRSAFHRDLGYAVVAIAPAISYLVISANDVVALLFERGAFRSADTAATAGVLELYALGLVAQVAIAVTLLPLFSLRGVVRRPARAAGIGLGVTVALDAFLVGPLGVAGLAIGNAVGITVMALLLLRLVDQLAFDIEWRQIGSITARALVAAAGSGAIALGARWLAGGVPLAVRVIGTAALLGIVYAGLARLLGVHQVGELIRALTPRWTARDGTSL